MEETIKFNFNGALPEKGKGRHLMPIPCNLWEDTKRRWLVKARVIIESNDYECYIIEKDDGYYSFMIPTQMADKVGISREVDITVEMLNGIEILESPYSIVNPIRKINNITYIKEPTGCTCGQTCIAMVAGVPVEEVCKIMGTGLHKSAWDGHMSYALDYYGFQHSKKFIPLRNKQNPKLPEMCILGVQLPKYKHSVLYYKGKYYDPEFGVSDSIHPSTIKIGTYWGIYT